MRHQATRDLHAYWEDRRGERAAPERQEIDPVAIRGILGDTFILEADEAGDWAFSLSGQRVNELFGAGLKGKSFISLWPLEERPQITVLCACVCDDTAAIVAGICGQFATRKNVPLEMLLLPLRHRGKTHARILGVLSATDVSDRYNTPTLERINLSSMRILTPALPVARKPFRVILPPERHLDTPPGADHAVPVRRHARLTVYQGGR